MSRKPSRPKVPIRRDRHLDLPGVRVKIESVFCGNSMR
jgi:hypothetical protein